MTEVKTIGDYINALPDEIKSMATTQLFDANTKLSDIPYLSHITAAVFCKVSYEVYTTKIMNKYTLTEKEGKYYTNW